MTVLHDLTGANRTLDDMLRRLERDDPEREAVGRGESMPVDTTAYIDAKSDAVRAQNDARFAEVLTELRLIRETSVTRKEMWSATGTGVAVVLGTLLAALAFAGDRFDAGITLSPALQEARNEQATVDGKQDEKLDLVIEQLGRIGDRLEGIEARLPAADLQP